MTPHDEPEDDRGHRARWGGLAGAAVAALVVIATLALRDDSAAAEPGRLTPLAPLVGGVWHELPPAEGADEGGEGDGPPLRLTYTWTLDRAALRETALDMAGHSARETLYFWHPGKDEDGSLAFQSVLADGEVREGILRPDAGGLELRYNAWRADGAGSYRERVRFLEQDRLLWTVHRKTETEELFQRERTFVRRRR